MLMQNIDVDNVTGRLAHLAAVGIEPHTVGIDCLWQIKAGGVQE